MPGGPVSVGFLPLRPRLRRRGAVDRRWGDTAPPRVPSVPAPLRIRRRSGAGGARREFVAFPFPSKAARYFTCGHRRLPSSPPPVRNNRDTASPVAPMPPYLVLRRILEECRAGCGLAV